MGSTLGGRKVWFDPDVNRLNYDEHGRLLGEFFDDDQILVVLQNGDFYLTNFDVNNHYEPNILRLEKYQADKVWTAVLFDADNQVIFIHRMKYLKVYSIGNHRQREAELVRGALGLGQRSIP